MSVIIPNVGDRLAGYAEEHSGTWFADKERARSALVVNNLAPLTSTRIYSSSSYFWSGERSVNAMS